MAQISKRAQLLNDSFLYFSGPISKLRCELVISADSPFDFFFFAALKSWEKSEVKSLFKADFDAKGVFGEMKFYWPFLNRGAD